jgi:hypothetical protein
MWRTIYRAGGRFIFRSGKINSAHHDKIVRHIAQADRRRVADKNISKSNVLFKPVRTKTK